MSESVTVRVHNCRNLKVSENEKVKFQKCQNFLIPKSVKIINCPDERSTLFCRTLSTHLEQNYYFKHSSALLDLCNHTKLTCFRSHRHPNQQHVGRQWQLLLQV